MADSLLHSKKKEATDIIVKQRMWLHSWDSEYS